MHSESGLRQWVTNIQRHSTLRRSYKLFERTLESANIVCRNSSKAAERAYLSLSGGGERRVLECLYTTLASPAFRSNSLWTMILTWITSNSVSPGLIESAVN